MGYFDSHLKRLHEELEDVLAETDLHTFRSRIEQKCTLESIPKHFVLLIDLASFLLHKIREQDPRKKTKALDTKEEFYQDLICKAKTE